MYQTHNTEFSTSGSNDFMAVLDGQQRLASVYIGLKGSYAYKLPRVWWENTEYAIPTRFLYLNIIEKLQDEEDGRIYDFRYLTDADYDLNKEKWFKVSDILKLRNIYEFNKFLDDHDYKTNQFAYEALSRFQESIFTDRVINYFLEKEQSLDKALNIFIRINSGGEPLDFSDLLLSIAIANWTKRDAKKEIYRLVDEIRDKGFFISKDLILKTFLLLYSSDIRFKVANFSTSNAKLFEDRWDLIKSALHGTFDLIKSFGFTDTTLTSKNAVIPIAYYLYHRDIAEECHKKKSYEKDRKIIKKWLHVVLIKRTFGGQADTVLSKIRGVFTTDVSKEKIGDDLTEFPSLLISESLKGTTKDLTFDDAYIENLLLTRYEDPLCFSILAVLYPYLDYQNGDFHKDHIHPKSLFTTRNLKAAGIGKDQLEFYVDPKNYNSVLNLQLLDGNENKAKNDSELGTWVKKESKNKGLSVTEFCERHLLPELFDISDFEGFISTRKQTLSKILMRLT